METGVTRPSWPFLADRIVQRDACLIQVIDQMGEQTVRARVDKVYTDGKATSTVMHDGQIEFVHAPDTWGNPPLQPGERAIVFVGPIMGRLYEAPWHGHLLIEQIDGTPVAVFPVENLSQDPDLPTHISSATTVHPTRPTQSAIRFDMLEHYLVELGLQS